MAKQIPGFPACLLRRNILQRRGQPFVYQHDVEVTALIAERLFVFIAITQHQRRIDAHHRHPKLRNAIQEVRRFLRRFGKPAQEAFNMLRFAIR
ncbi:hypothetical protein D3C72_2010020 [compost metagenome]